jgi:GT2 family glycosyltransferase
MGIARSRNECVKLSRGEYIFFTDGDCIVSNNWLEEGLKFITKEDCIGIEGRTYYVGKDYPIRFSDDYVKNSESGQFMTCNIAYKKSYVERVGGFDKRYSYHSDRDLALRLIKFGKISFNPNMIVYHQKRLLTPKKFVQTGKRIRSKVLLYKKFGERQGFLWRIIYPLNLLAILFPPSILISFFHHKYVTAEDISLFPFIYIRLLYERLSLWSMCAQEKVFLV